MNVLADSARQCQKADVMRLEGSANSMAFVVTRLLLKAGGRRTGVED